MSEGKIHKGRHVDEELPEGYTGDVLIWSGQWGSWWRANGGGYTLDKSEAGRYTLADAHSRVCHVGPEKQIVIKPAPATPPPTALPEGEGVAHIRRWLAGVANGSTLSWPLDEMADATLALCDSHDVLTADRARLLAENAALRARLGLVEGYIAEKCNASPKGVGADPCPICGTVPPYHHKMDCPHNGPVGVVDHESENDEQQEIDYHAILNALTDPVGAVERATGMVWSSPKYVADRLAIAGRLYPFLAEDDGESGWAIYSRPVSEHHKRLCAGGGVASEPIRVAPSRALLHAIADGKIPSHPPESLRVLMGES